MPSDRSRPSVPRRPKPAQSVAEGPRLGSPLAVGLALVRQPPPPSEMMKLAAVAALVAAATASSDAGGVLPTVAKEDAGAGAAFPDSRLITPAQEALRNSWANQSVGQEWKLCCTSFTMSKTSPAEFHKSCDQYPGTSRR